MEEKKAPKTPVELKDEDVDAASGGGSPDEKAEWVCPFCGAVVRERAGFKLDLEIIKHQNTCEKTPKPNLIWHP